MDMYALNDETRESMSLILTRWWSLGLPVQI